MDNFHEAPAVVVGIDGSKAATRAAVWAVDEAVARDIPLRLVYVIDPADFRGTDADHAHSQFAAARAALSDGQRAAEAAGEPVKVETEIRCGRPLRTLLKASRSAVMVCVGSIGRKHACRGVGSIATALAGSARCPVVVIHPSGGRIAADTGCIVAEVNASPDNSGVLRCAFEEARLRHVPLRVVASSQTPSQDRPGDKADRIHLVQAHLNRRIGYWTRVYPDVEVESIAVHGGVLRYLASNAASVQLFVTDVRDHRNLSTLGQADCSVLTVCGKHL